VRETWRPIIGFEGLYEVSDLGRLRSLDKFIKSSNGGVQLCRGRVLKLQHRGRYPHITLHRGREYKNTHVHTAVLEAFIGPRPPGMEACHGPDPNPDNCALSNLRWDTKSNNQKDRLTQGGRDYRGSKHPGSLLTDVDVERMRDLHRTGLRAKAISKWLGTRNSNTWLIIKGKAWRHVL
jgi:hypothetical protein